MVAVVPKFKDIFKDFGATLPAITTMLINFSDWFVSGSPAQLDTPAGDAAGVA